MCMNLDTETLMTSLGMLVQFEGIVNVSIKSEFIADFIDTTFPQCTNNQQLVSPSSLQTSKYHRPCLLADTMQHGVPQALSKQPGE